MRDRPNVRPLPTQDKTNTEKCEHISMPQVGFEPMIPFVKWPKTVCASDCKAIGTVS